MKTKFILLLIICLLYTLQKEMNAQNMEWATRMGSIDYDYALQLAADAGGNVYTTGYFKGTVDFDPGPGAYNLTSSGYDDIFITKFDVNGNFVWATGIGSWANDVGKAVVFDPNGYIYITGYFTDTVDFDPGPGINNLISYPGDRDLFICKLDLAGNFVWAGRIGGSQGDNVFAITLDPAGNVILTGLFFISSDFDPGPAVYNIFTSGNASFICKLTAAGNFVWAKHFEDAVDGAFSLGICTGGNGNVYTIGYFDSNVDFNPAAAAYNLSPVGVEDIFISALDSSGNFLWAKKIGGVNGYARGKSVATDAIGNVYLTGYFKETTDFNPGTGAYILTPSGSYDVFICKLDVTGNFVWGKHSGGPNLDQGSSIYADANSHIYVSGNFNSTADFDPGPGTYNLVSAGMNDIFISQLDSAGNFFGAVKMGGAKNDYCYSLCLDNNKIYATGIFEDTCDFDPGNGIYNLISDGVYDAYVVKLNTLTGTHELQSSIDGITIYPSPFYEKLNCEINQPGLSEIIIYDIASRKILQHEFTNFISLKTERFVKGIYLYEVRNKKRVIKKGKILKD